MQKNKSFYLCSQIGTRHSENGFENEDVVKGFETRSGVFVALADGVSSCSKSREGANLAVETVHRLFSKCGDYLWSLDNASIKELILSEVRYVLRKQAEIEQISPAEYSSTLAFCFYRKKEKELLVFSIGNTTMTVLEKGGYRHLICPDESPEVCCTTTVGAESATTVFRRSVSGEQNVVLFSDGGWDSCKKVLENGCTENPAAVFESALKKAACPDDSSFILLHIAA